jgi:hypothetical protein
MGYELQAIIGREAAISRAAKAVSKAVVVPLEQELLMIPLGEDLHDELQTRFAGGEGDHSDHFIYLSVAVAEWIAEASEKGPLAYVEADYFGGIGKQSSVVWKEGKVILEPAHGERGPINRALRALGVRAQPNKDEFETVGLRRHRDMEDWLEET